MDGVTVINHPLVQHKLTIMRKKETSTAGFRRLLREIASQVMGFSDEEINGMTRTAIEAAFVDEPTRQRLLAAL